jgi:PilZ domain
VSEMNVPAVGDFTFLERQVVAMQRRTAVRYRCAVGTPGRLSFPDGRESRDIWVYNLSETGIGLNLAAPPLQANTPVIIRLRGPAQGSTVDVAARVVHVTPEADGTWRIGCAFEERLTEEALKSLL